MDAEFKTLLERADYYLEKAAEADRMLAVAKDPLARESWKRLALSWRELAQQLVATKL